MFQAQRVYWFSVPMGPHGSFFFHCAKTPLLESLCVFRSPLDCLLDCLNSVLYIMVYLVLLLFLSCELILLLARCHGRNSRFVRQTQSQYFIVEETKEAVLVQIGFFAEQSCLVTAKFSHVTADIPSNIRGVLSLTRHLECTGGSLALINGTSRFLSRHVPMKAAQRLLLKWKVKSSDIKCQNQQKKSWKTLCAYTGKPIFATPD